MKTHLWLLICLSSTATFQCVRSQNAQVEEAREKCIDDWLRKQPDLLRRFGRQHLGFMCQRSEEWTEAAASPTSPVADFLTPRQLAYLGELKDCRGSDCLRTLANSSNVGTLRLNVSNLLDLVSKNRGGEIRVVDMNRQNQIPGGDPRAIRKEYRAMSDEERLRYHEAIKRLKTDRIDGMSKYDLLVVYHTPQEAPEAHWGPAFLPYHREYLKQYELALRQVDPSVGLPYWDSTLDEGLPNPRDSVLWSQDFLGNGEGPVTSGPFGGWTAVQELSSAPGERRLVRQIGTSPYGGLYKPSDVDFILTRTRFEDLTSCVDPTFEVTHGIVHSFVGGYMLDIGISPNDPSFFNHHCFIDSLWEQFRQTRQSAQQRQTDYPTAERSCNEFHTANAPMKPFTLRNVDGLSDRYTAELYRYESRPVCGGQNNAECNPNSPYLFCDTRANRCLSKIQINGNCSGLEGQNACYRGRCIRGVCSLTAEVPEVVVTGGTSPPQTLPPQTTRTYPTEIVTVPTLPTQPTYRPSPTTQRPPIFVPQTPPTQQPPIPPTNPNPSYRPSRPTNGGYYNWVTTAAAYVIPPAVTPIAYISITVVKGYGGYMAQHPADAIVSIQGLGSPPNYVSVTPAAMWANISYPSYTGACLVMIYDPDQTTQPVQFRFSVTDALGQYCTLQCWSEEVKRYVNCPNGNSFSVVAGGRGGDPIPYYRSSQEALEKRWVGSGYQRYRLPDYIVFQCP